jgi:RNA polymerase sigma-70 factor (ECF subfamily)
MVVEDVWPLVERAQAGDGRAFGELYARYAPGVLRFHRDHLNGCQEAAEDLTQDVFIKVFERLDRYQFQGTQFSTWLYRVARNHLIDHVRLQRRTITLPLATAPEIPEATTEQAIAYVLASHDVVPILSHLTQDQCDVVTLRFLEGYSVSETADLLGKSEDAVKQLQKRTLAKLRRIAGQSTEVAVTGRR